MHQKPDIHNLLKQMALDGVGIRISGNCMYPHFDDRETIQVAQAAVWWPGDILVYRNPQGKMVAHRMLGFYRRAGRWKLLFQADSARRPDRGVLPEQVLGKVIGIEVDFKQRLRAIGRYLHFALFNRQANGGETT